MFTTEDTEAIAPPFHGIGGRSIRVLAHGASSMKSLTQNERFLYWTCSGDGTITRIPKDGGIPLILATDIFDAGPIALEPSEMIWASGNVLRRATLDGDDVEVIVEGEGTITGLAVRGEFVAWSESIGALRSRLMVLRRGKKWTMRRVASFSMFATCVALGDRDVVWANHSATSEGGVAYRALLKTARPRAVFAKGVAGGMVTRDATHVYFARQDTSPSPHALAAVYRRALRGDRAEVIARFATPPDFWLAVDESHVYVQDRGSGAIHRVPKDGGEPEPIVRSEDASVDASSLLVDDRCVYWTVRDSPHAGGAVFKTAK